jgi:hypothetical protein
LMTLRLVCKKSRKFKTSSNLHASHKFIHSQLELRLALSFSDLELKRTSQDFTFCVNLLSWQLIAHNNNYHDS